MTSVGNSDITNHRPAKLYNLDVILAVGCRVKSKRGILFRRWATAVLRDYLIKGSFANAQTMTVVNGNIQSSKLNSRLKRIDGTVATIIGYATLTRYKLDYENVVK